MKHLLLFTITLCSYFTSLAQKDTLHIDGLMGIKFGEIRQNVAKAIEAKGGKRLQPNNPDTTTVTYIDLNFAGRKTFLTVFKFYNNRFYTGFVLFKPDLETHAIEDFNDIKREISSKYYVTDKDFEQYKSPYEKNDGYTETAIKIGKAEFATFWKFKSLDNSEDDYIVLKIKPSMLIELMYQDGKLTAIANREEEKKVLNDY
jgi:hypothetical protein